MRKFYLYFLFVSIFVFSKGYCASITVHGEVYAAYPEGPVENARVIFSNETQTVSGITDKDGKYSLTINAAITGVYEQKPSSFYLYQNYPNPFNPSTVIRYELKTHDSISLDIFNVMGQQVRTLYKGYAEAGFHEALWNGRDDSGRSLGAGIYFYRLLTSKSAVTRKMLLMDGGGSQIFSAMKQSYQAVAPSDTLFFDITTEHENYFPVKRFHQGISIRDTSIEMGFWLYIGKKELHPLYCYSPYAIYYPYSSSDSHYPLKFSLHFGYANSQGSFISYCQDDKYPEFYRVSETGTVIAAGDSAVMTVVDTPISKRKNLTFTTHIYQISGSYFVFSNARLLTFGYVDSATVIFGPYYVGKIK